MNLELIFKLLQNPQFANILKPIVELLIKELAQELNKPEVQKQIVDAIFGAFHTD